MLGVFQQELYKLDASGRVSWMFGMYQSQQDITVRSVISVIIWIGIARGDSMQGEEDQRSKSIVV